MARRGARTPLNGGIAVGAVLAPVGGALATLAVGSADLALVTYPLYLTVANLGLAILIHQRRLAQTVGTPSSA